MPSKRMTTCLLAIVVALAGCGSEQERPLPSIGGGKSDFGEFDLHFPTIGKGKSLQWRFEASGSFKIELTQPDVASSQQALVRLRLDDGTVSKENDQSSKTPSLEWTTASSGMIAYQLTIINRSSSKVLKARVTGTAIAGFAPPTRRRVFCEAFSFDGPKVAVAFFDADATLRIPIGDGYTPAGPGDQVLLPGAIKAVRQANERGDLVAIVSNQGGVHYGSISFEDAEAALAETASLLAARGARVHTFDFAEGYDGNDRKPGTGMADRLEQKLGAVGLQLDWSASSMVGDAGWKKDVDTEPPELGGADGTDFSNSDRRFAEALSIPYNHPRYTYGWNAAPYNVHHFTDADHVEQFNAAYPDFDD